ncbi:radical SAM protein, partial [candidate division MSBL1 archaeon SCGC-AAA261F19]
LQKSRRIPRFSSGRGGDEIGRSHGVSDGNGIAFVSRIGEIYPSGFLPISGGNVRDRGLIESYRESQIFCDLRDKSLLKGKCGACEYNRICGGSRARAYTVYGDYLGPDPLCAYIPKGWDGGFWEG